MQPIQDFRCRKLLSLNNDQNAYFYNGYVLNLPLFRMIAKMAISDAASKARKSSAFGSLEVLWYTR